jgi:hypothetical protein
MGSVTKLNLKHARKTTQRAHKASSHKQRNAMYGVGAVALTLTALSLTHLTCGIAQVTGGSTLESAAMAIGVDAGFIALEVAQVVKVSDQASRVISKYAPPAIIGTMLASAALNAFGFASHAQGVMLYPAIALGCAIPALIYALTRVAVAMSK